MSRGGGGRPGSSCCPLASALSPRSLAAQDGAGVRGGAGGQGKLACQALTDVTHDQLDQLALSLLTNLLRLTN